MKFFSGIALGLVSLSSVVSAASGKWSFDDATLTVQSKGAGVGKGLKEKLHPSSTGLVVPVTLKAEDTLKIILTTTSEGKAKKPHQAFFKLEDTITGLEDSFAFIVKENGKGKVELTQKDLPVQFVNGTTELRASIVIASFGSVQPYANYAFQLDVKTDGAAKPSEVERYTAKPEISHIFRDDPRQPPKIISLVFSAAILATLPILLAGWLMLGGNITHAGKAFGSSPIAHALFFGSVIAMEGVFFMYYVSWNLFQTLPAAGVVGLVAFVSGSRALTEVQDRRLAGER